MLAVDYQYISYVSVETVRFLHTPDEIFLRNSFILIKLHSVTILAYINILLGYSVGLGSFQPITWYMYLISNIKFQYNVIKFVVIVTTFDDVINEVLFRFWK